MAREQRLSSGELFVAVPGGGFVPQSLVVHVPEGMRLQRQDDGEIVGFDRDGRLHRFDPPSAEAVAWRDAWQQRRPVGFDVEGFDGATGATGATEAATGLTGAGPTGATGPAGPPGPPGTTEFVVVGALGEEAAGTYMSWPVGTAPGDIALIMVYGAVLAFSPPSGYTTHFEAQSTDSASAKFWSLYSKVLTEVDIPNRPSYYGGLVVMTMRNALGIALKSVVHNTASMSIPGFTKSGTCLQVISIVNGPSSPGGNIIAPDGFVEQIEVITGNYASHFALALPANYTDGSNPVYSGVATTRNHGMALLEVTGS